jgi:hypothetical protein
MLNTAPRPVVIRSDGLASKMRTPDEINRPVRGVVVDGFHPLSGQRFGVFAMRSMFGV